ncbi:MAG: hypothetical protein LDL23_11390 [Flavobacterium sp.]|uniref:hypothetical protein n=1 Tax=Flavobacterium sp. TaxID=239 RepID=UPI0025B9CF4E|nr:hypothetical protein [Flavobacterium sp.]MCA1967238.1 hypothetical protein [Flavobacterium sp.]
MKKVFFSAVALITFSISAMANEIEEKKVDVKTIETEKTEKKIVKDDCRVMKFTAYSLARESGMSHEAASAYSYQIYFSCLNVQSIEG